MDARRTTGRALGAVTLLLAFGLAATLFLVPARALADEPATGWQHDSAGWWYSRSDGSYPADQWARIDGSWYLFDDSGYMRTGWANVDGAWYYLQPGSGAMRTGWLGIGNTWYYLNPGGDMAEGWKSVGGAWYYLTPGSGAMATGWQQVDGVWYYLKLGSGDMAEGWKAYGGVWYYLTPGSGAMATGWRQIGGAWYYLNPGGDMAEGWRRVDGSWYYLQPGSGDMAEGWTRVGTSWYYLQPGSGAMGTGWLKYGGAWYYLAPESGAMATGWRQVGSDWYYFEPLSSGHGAMLEGLQRINGSWYYLVPGSGARATGWQRIGGVRYYFDDSGARAVGWRQIGADRYFFDAEGNMVTNRWIDDRWLTETGVMAVNAWVDNGKFFVGFDGVLVPDFKGFEEPLPAAYDNALDRWIGSHISADMTALERVEAIQRFTTSCAFSSECSTAQGLLEGRRGNSSAAARFLVDVCTKMGIRAEVRFAGEDAEKYYLDKYESVPDRYNAFVWVGDEKYVADAMPGTYTAAFKWEPDRWGLADKVINGELHPAFGPRDRDPKPFTVNVGGKSYLGGYDVEIGLTKSPLKISYDEAAPNEPLMLRITAFGHLITDVSVSNDKVLQPAPLDESDLLSATVTIVGKGSSFLVFEMDNNSGGLFYLVEVS